MARNGSLLTAAAIGLMLPLLATATAEAETGIPVVMNQAKILKLARPANTIVIGNPEIADATVQDATTLVLTGRGFGVTNLVVLDEGGSPIVDERVVVSRDNPNSVRVYRRASVQTLSCTPYCESAYRTQAEQGSDSGVERLQ